MQAVGPSIVGRDVVVDLESFAYNEKPNLGGLVDVDLLVDNPVFDEHDRVLDLGGGDCMESNLAMLPTQN